MVRVIARTFIGTDIDGLIIERDVISKRVVVVLMIAARVIFIDKNFKGIVIPVLD